MPTVFHSREYTRRNHIVRRVLHGLEDWLLNVPSFSGSDAMPARARVSPASSVINGAAHVPAGRHKPY